MDNDKINKIISHLNVYKKSLSHGIDKNKALNFLMKKNIKKRIEEIESLIIYLDSL